MLNIHPVYGVLFVLYISVMILSLLNIMTGICVNNALDMVQVDRDLMLKLEMDRRMQHMEAQLKQIQNSMNVNDVHLTRFREMGDNTDSSLTTSVRWDTEDMILLPKEAQASQPRRSSPPTLSSARCPW